MKRISVWFTGRRSVSIREERVPLLKPAQVLVQTMVSAISPGTELLVYRGEASKEMPADTTIPALSGSLEFPLKYGYSAVGRIISISKGINKKWRGKIVFAYHPHESYFTSSLDNLVELTPEIAPEDAAFLSNMETAINFVMDGRPMIGENVIVFGQGIVGLLTTSLLSQFPLARLITLDRYPLRRKASIQQGAHASLDPHARNVNERIKSLLKDTTPHPYADLVFELSGQPEALNQAIAVTGYNGRVVIGSWYGQKKTDVALGGTFHRSRIRLVSSQVSTIAPVLTGRWNKRRRILSALSMLRLIKPSEHFITHRYPVTRAAQAYSLLDKRPHTAIQVLLTYQE